MKSGIYRPWIQRQGNRYDDLCQWRILLTPALARSAKQLSEHERRVSFRRRLLPTNANSTAATLARLSAERKTCRSKVCCGSRVDFVCGRRKYSRTQDTERSGTSCGDVRIYLRMLMTVRLPEPSEEIRGAPRD